MFKWEFGYSLNNSLVHSRREKTKIKWWSSVDTNGIGFFCLS